MKFEDTSQNLRSRLWFVQSFIILLLALLGVRLYYRQLISLAKPLAEVLGVDPDTLRERFEQIGSQPAFESILVKQGATPGDIAWVEAHELEFPELRVEQQPQRRYPENGMLAHVLGYVGEVSPEQLKQAA